MAVYTQVQATAGHNIMHVVGDGAGNIYYIAWYAAGVSVRVQKYNIPTDSLTDISGATFDTFRTGSDAQASIAWFNSNLYVCIGAPAGTNEARIYRWDGGTSWTQVDSTACFNGVATLDSGMDADSGQLVYSVLLGPASTTRTCRRSTDGTSWATQSPTGASPLRAHIYYSAMQGEILIGSGVLAGYDIDAYGGGVSWSPLNAAAFASKHFIGTGDTYSFLKQTVGTGLYYSPDWGVTANAIAGNWYAPTPPCVFELYAQTFAALAANVNRDQVRLWNPSTLTFDLDGTPSAGNMVVPRLVAYSGYLYAAVYSTGIYRRDTPLSSVEYVPVTGYSPVSMDVSADDYYLHIACLFGGNPVLLRMLADLTADPVQMYAPGAGSAIGVKCGDENESWVWIAGSFGVPKVRLSIDDGTTWTTKDPGTWNGVALPMVVGPWLDNLVLVPTDGDDDMHETEDGGLNWATLNASLPFDVGAMDRLDIDLDEIVIGSDAGRDLQFSPGNAAEFHDITDLGMPNVRISDVIVG